jgi:hypothetical protein
VIPALAAPRPEYLVPVNEPRYGTRTVRICDGVGLPVMTGRWNIDSRHHYSKDQPWSPDGRLVKLEQRGGSPAQLILDAATWRPVTTTLTDSPAGRLLRASYESRWRGGVNSTQLVSWIKASQMMVVWDATNGAIEYAVRIPSEDADYGLIHESQVSADGRWVAVSTHFPSPRSSGRVDYLQIVDLERKRVGPRNFIPMPYDTEDGGDIDWVSVSQHGTYVVVKYSSRATPEYARVFVVHPDLTVTPQRMSPMGLRMGPTQNDVEGWIACLSHSVMALEAGREVLVGGVRGVAVSNLCNAAQVKSEGRIVTIDLASGVHRHVSAGSAYLPAGMIEAEDQHCGCAPPGWVLATYTGRKGQYASEMVSWPLDGSRECVRWGVTRTIDSAYRREAHGVQSPDGTQVMFSSNWCMAADPDRLSEPLGPGLDDVKAYVMSAV